MNVVEQDGKAILESSWLTRCVRGQRGFALDFCPSPLPAAAPQVLRASSPFRGAFGAGAPIRLLRKGRFFYLRIKLPKTAMNIRA